MTHEATFETIAVSQQVIDRVDGELGLFDEFRRGELEYLADNNPALRSIVIDLHEITITQDGEETARQTIAGSLFASRVLRYAAVEAGTVLPRLNSIRTGKKLSELAERLTAHEEDEFLFLDFEALFSNQQPVVERLQKFRHSFSRIAATVIFTLHEDVLKD